MYVVHCLYLLMFVYMDHVSELKLMYVVISIVDINIGKYFLENHMFIV